MSNVWDDRKKSLEEDYFRRKDQEAIEKLRAQRQSIQSQSGLTCPKCGDELVEISYDGVTIDRCNGCSGVWLDAGELEILSEKDQDGGWLRSWWKKIVP
jgi:hypothetical protein